VSWSRKKPQGDVVHHDLVAVMRGHKVETRARACSEVNLRTGPSRELTMTGDEVRVAMRFDDMFDRQAVSLRVFDVDIDVALRIHHSSFRAGTNEVRRMGKTAEIKLPEVHGGIVAGLLRNYPAISSIRLNAMRAFAAVSGSTVI
jgi:hypothetical protein